MSIIEIGLIVVILFVLFRLVKAFSSKSIGNLGERRVAKMLSKLPADYKVYNNVIIPSYSGTSQIDHLVISKYGIFVIETKNYSGVIYGNENSEYWKQCFYRTKFEMVNPVRQNHNHVMALKKVFSGLPEIPIHSIIAFVGSADLNIDVYSAHIVFGSELLDKIMLLSKPCVEQKIAWEYSARIEHKRIESTKETEKQHNENARNAVRQHNLKVANNICPRCGGKLVLRKGKFGSFYGCSNYPTSKVTTNA